jgi:DNA/RNA endonuclease G (NUC1)
VPVSFDNTLESRTRGDYAVPTLFNGNFDAVSQTPIAIFPPSSPATAFRTAISDAIPGWSFHNRGNSGSTWDLVDWKDIPALNIPRLLETQPQIEGTYLEQVGYVPTQSNYALRLKNGDSVTHNRFVMPEWGTLRFNLHVPQDQLNRGGRVTVSIQGDAPDYETYRPLGTIDLTTADGRTNSADENEIPYLDGYNDADTYRIGFGTQGFETFHIDNIPNELRGKTAKLKFEVFDGTVFLDDVFFKSVHLKFGNPSFNGHEARSDAENYPNNYLIEKPQYSLSYNESKKGSNWVSWQLNKSWLGVLPPPVDPLFDQNDPTTYRAYPWLTDSALLDTGLYTTDGEDYTGSGFDRGHIAPREDRNRTQKDQFATFLTTNLLPQQPVFNERGLWRQLENFSTQLALKRSWELYIIAGGVGSANGEIPSDNPLNENSINLPDSFWKVIVILEPGQGLADITVDTPIIAINLPNANVAVPDDPDVPEAPKWYNPEFITSVRDIEKLTGLNLLSNLPLPKEVVEQIKNKKYEGPTRWQDFPYANTNLS